MKKYILTYIALIISFCVYTQDTINPNTYKKFFYDNGKVSSEGYLKDGKPDGYWKTYYEDGVLKSEGNRLNFNLDSLWKFYNTKGEIVVDIKYKNGLKNGLRNTYHEDEKISEYFVDNVKQGLTTIYYSDGKVKKTINFKDGREHGISTEYDKNGIIITVIEYKRGFIVDQEFINRTNKDGSKQGKWKYFYPNGNLKIEGWYSNGMKNGYFKEYDKTEKLIEIKKYVNDELQIDVEELKEYEIRKDYYPDGKIKIVGSYINGIAEGIRKEYSKEGKIEKAYILNKGRIVGEGLIDEYGKKQGYWKEYYQSGQLQGDGFYKDNIKIKEWKYYYRNKQLEQIGSYDDEGTVIGAWTWYYPSGNLLREEKYVNGVENGPFIEYSDEKNIIVKGEYVNGIKEGIWIFQIHDHKETGRYINGVRDGIWKYYYKNDNIKFEGKFVDGLQDGRHKYYWKNGNIKNEGRYIMGLKEGEWRKYDLEGNLFLTILYSNGIEKNYDRIKIEPELFEEDME
ncbi:toxin-antitoxin system YwqK family antitoxin [Bacteroidota bacterium]